VTSFDASIDRFRLVAGDRVDLTDATQAKACLVWLNAWGCRQFSVEHHEAAAGVLASWWVDWIDQLPPPEADIDQLDDNALRVVSSAYGDLAQREAGRGRLADGRESVLTVGPTGAGKILHIVRPRTFAPWDDPIRRALRLDPGSRGDLRYLTDVRDQVRSLRDTAVRNGLDADDIPSALGRPSSTLPKLVDEYNWVTINRGLTLPSPRELAMWNRWADDRSS
jgi:hypothetical protein